MEVINPLALLPRYEEDRPVGEKRKPRSIAANMALLVENYPTSGTTQSRKRTPKEKRVATRRACMCMTRRNPSWSSMTSNKGKARGGLLYGLGRARSRTSPICESPSERTRYFNSTASSLYTMSSCDNELVSSPLGESRAKRGDVRENGDRMFTR